MGVLGQLFASPRNRRKLKANLLMLRSEGSESKFSWWSQRLNLLFLCFLLPLALVAPAAAQDFTLTTSTLDPLAVGPNGTSSANVTVVANAGFVGPVSLSCTVTPSVQITSTAFPTCAVSPTSLIGSGGASLTISTSLTTPQIGYTITVTGTDSSGTVSSAPELFTVLAVTPQFTITVTTPLAPTSVVAGKGSEGEVTVNPLDGYNTPSGGYITLYCGTISPLVTIAPVCSFAYPNNGPGLQLNGNSSASAQVTVTTFGPVPTGAAARPRTFYAVWFPVPMLCLTGLGAAIGGKKSRKAWALLALFIISGAIVLLPACNSTTANPSTSTPNGTTPANTYTFTIVGVDTDGVVSSNTGTNSTGPTVSLTVTAPK